MTTPLIWNAFEGASAGNIQQGLWAHPRDDRLGFATMEHWLNRARRYEAAGFDAVFFPDVLGVYDTYRGTPDIAIEQAVEFPALDPAALIPAMAAVTTHLGFVVTASTTYEHPFPHARRYSTLDHLTAGRIGWNIVTSYLPSAARNFVMRQQLSHDERYDRADEFMEVVYGLWEHSWADGAVLADRQRRIYADPRLVRPIDHNGRYYSVAGPHLVGPSPQRTPVLFQAGTSGRGVRFAGTHAEVIFVGGDTAEAHLRARDQITEAAVGAGRDPADVRLIGGLQVIVGATTDQAERRAEEYVSFLSAEGSLAHWCGVSGRDLSAHDDSTVFADGNTDHVQTQARRFSASGTPRTVGNLKAHFGTLGSYVQPIVGTPEDVADEITRRAVAGRLDGFNVQPVVSPETLDDFAEHIAPRLRERGLMREGPADPVLRRRWFGEARLPSRHPAHEVGA